MNKTLLQIYDMVIRSGVCPETPLSAWSEIIPFCHRKGYIHAFFDRDDLVAAVCAYRIPVFEKKVISKYPEKEEGTILYIPWAVSHSYSITTLLRMLKQYISTNHITELAYYRHNSDTDLKRIKINVKAKKSITA